MPPMKLDTATIIFVGIVIDVCLLLILLHTWFTRKTYPGFCAWIAGSASWAVGAVVMMLLNALQPQFIPTIIGAV